MNSQAFMLNLRDGCVALCPLLALVALRAWLGAAGPASASASPTQPVAAPAQVSAFEALVPLETELAYLERVDSARSRKVPDIFPRQAVIEIEPEQVETPVKVEPIPDPPVDTLQEPEVIVTSIMAGRTPVAIINGRAYRTGDAVAEEWCITSISDGLVTIVHRTGAVRVLRINRSSR